MIIVSVRAQFSEQSVEPALKILQTLNLQTQNAKGRVEYEIFVDPIQPTKVFLYQIWASNVDFEAYRTGTHFAEMGKNLAPLMTNAPQTDIFNAQKIT